MKTKAKARKQQQQQKKQQQGGGNQRGVPKPPTKKALNAAVQAMSGAGFSVPKGMQMVISFGK